MSLRNIFLKIKDQTPNELGIKFSDFTNYLCEVNFNINVENIKRRSRHCSANEASSKIKNEPRCESSEINRY